MSMKWVLLFYKFTMRFHSQKVSCLKWAWLFKQVRLHAVPYLVNTICASTLDIRFLRPRTFLFERFCVGTRTMLYIAELRYVCCNGCRLMKSASVNTATAIQTLNQKTGSHSLVYVSTITVNKLSSFKFKFLI